MIQWTAVMRNYGTQEVKVKVILQHAVKALGVWVVNTTSQPLQETALAPSVQGTQWALRVWTLYRPAHSESL